MEWVREASSFRCRPSTQAASLMSALHEEHLFTLRDITENPRLKCYGCGNTIGIGDGIYDPLIREIRNTLAAIDYIQSAPSFINQRP